MKTPTNAMTAARVDGKLTIDEIASQINNQWGLMHEQWTIATLAADQARIAGFRAGGLLLEARETFKGDKEFGQWRNDHIQMGRSWATRLMQINRQYNIDSLPDGLSLSALALISQDNVTEAMRIEIEHKAADPEQKTPSVRDIKEIITPTDDAQDAPAREDEASPSDVAREGEVIKADEDLKMPKAMKDRLAKEAAAAMPALNPTDPVDVAQTLLERPRNERVSRWTTMPAAEQNSTEAFILLGLPPYHDGCINKDTLIDLIGFYRQEHGGDHWDQAYKAICREFFTTGTPAKQ